MPFKALSAKQREKQSLLKRERIFKRRIKETKLFLNAKDPVGFGISLALGRKKLKKTLASEKSTLKKIQSGKKRLKSIRLR